MQKKVFSKEELSRLSPEDIIDKLKHENYSLLKTLGADELRKEMAPVGKACNVAINYFLGTTGPKNNPEKHIKAARRKLVKILSKIAPGTYRNFPRDNQDGLVVGFNHPSLGEILRILLMKIDMMGDKPMCFPVNLPWYEALAPNFERIKQFGIVITPTITPSTWKKLALQEGTTEYEVGNRLKRGFRELYTNLSREIIKDGGVIFVAPSATRQRTVFKNKAAYDGDEAIIPTMSLLATKLYSDPQIKCSFLPMAVLPPKNYKKGLNMGKRYRLIAGEEMTADEIRKKYFKEKSPKRLEGFDYDFHLKIAKKLPKEFWY